MRGFMIGLVAVLGFIAGSQTAVAVPSLPSHSAVGLLSQSLPAATHNCGQGRHWVAAGYAKHGKYRAGHCAPN
jgi:hypothetical protein